MGNSIVYPTPPSTYKLAEDDPTLLNIPQKIDIAYCGSWSCSENRKDSIKIPCRYIPSPKFKSPYLIIFFHGNSEDIGKYLTNFLEHLAFRFSMNVLCPEYPGYGTYKKKDDLKSMDEAIMEDAKRVITYCHKELGFKYKNMILIGRSLGSGVAIQLACEYTVKGLILISPFTSIRDVAKQFVGNILSLVVPDVFRSIDYIDNILAPLLIIHGREDKLIPLKMPTELYKKTVREKVMVVNDLMTHNHFHVEHDIFFPIEEFMTTVLKLERHLALAKTFIREETSEDDRHHSDPF